jgi:hypothetical protein
MIEFYVLAILAVVVGTFAGSREGARRERERLAQASIEHLPDPTAIWNRDGLLSRVEEYLGFLANEAKDTGVDRASMSRAQAVVREAADLLDYAADLIDSGKIVVVPAGKLKRDRLRAEQQANGLASLLFDRSSEMRRVKVVQHRGTLRVSLYEHRVLNEDTCGGPLAEAEVIPTSEKVRG